jgi:hypothetical protein
VGQDPKNVILSRDAHVQQLYACAPTVNILRDMQSYAIALADSRGSRMRSTTVKPKSDPFLKSNPCYAFTRFPAQALETTRRANAKALEHHGLAGNMRLYGWNHFPVFFLDIWEIPQTQETWFQ